MDVLAGLLSGVGGVAGIWIAMKVLAPPIGKLVGKFWSASRQLESDRDRVTAGLRLEIADLYRQLEHAKEQLQEAEGKYANYRSSSETALAEVREKLRLCEAMVERYIRRMPE